MDTSKPTVRQLFDPRIVYLIPNYQRTYVWNEYDQWEPLWLDVAGIANPLPGGSEQYDPASRKPHFLGATVLKEIQAPVESARQLVVVDGQQRLTTIQLLLTAVADTFRDHDELSALESSARNLTINWVSGAHSPSEPDKIHPLAGDFRSFIEVMKASRDDGTIFKHLWPDSRLLSILSSGSLPMASGGRGIGTAAEGPSKRSSDSHLRQATSSSHILEP